MDDDYEIHPFSIILPKTSTYVKKYTVETKWMYFLIEDDELLEKHNDSWNKVSNSIKNNLLATPLILSDLIKRSAHIIL